MDKYALDNLNIYEAKFSKVFYNDKEGYVYNYYLSDDGNSSDAIDYTYFYSNINKFANDNKVKSTILY